MAQIKNITPFISNTIPKYILESNSLLVPFIESYYEWTNLTGNVQDMIYKLSTANSVDDGLNTFYKEFYSEFLGGLPSEILADPATLIKNITHVYRAKGTPKAVQFLLRLLFNQDSEIFYPATQIFKPSDAKWNREVSVRFMVQTGTITDFENFIVTITTSTRVYEIDVNKIVQIGDNLFEAFIDANYKLDIPDGGTISADGFVGVLQKTITKNSIFSAGRGFSVGDLFEINNTAGSGTKIRIKRVIAGGGIRNIEIFQFGIGYTNAFYYTLSPASNIVLNETKNLSISLTGTGALTADYTIDNNVNNVSDYMQANRYDYTNLSPTDRSTDYFEDNTYVGQNVAYASDISTNIAEADDQSAVILFQFGYVLEYPGYYSTNTGFPDDASYIQDGEYYQQYSYEVKAEVPFDSYKTPLLKLVHPAGLVAFGQYRIQTNLNIPVNVRNKLNRIGLISFDEVDVADALTKLSIKSLSDVAPTSELLAKSTTKVLADTVSANDDDVTTTLEKPFADIGSATDAKILSYSKPLVDEVIASDSITLAYAKTVEDEIVHEDYGVIVLGSGYYNYLSGQYWECGYVENETCLVPSNYRLLVNTYGDHLFATTANEFLIVEPPDS